jgi:DNA-binding winged helix-turn-helix (wHTH) protein
MDGLGSADIVEFAGFHFDCRRWLRYRLKGDDSGKEEVETLHEKALGVLSVLIEAQGDLVRTEEILEAVWPGMVGQLDNLYHQITFLRRVLEKNQKTGAVIKSVRGRGYKIAVPIIPAPAPLSADTASSVSVALVPPSRPIFYSLPSLPDHHQPREAEIAKVRAKLLDEGVAVDTTRVAGVVGLQGMGGIGKTVLATVLVHDPNIRSAFHDGAVWLTFGRHAPGLAKAAEFAFALTEVGASFSKSASMRWMRR